jgi:YbbR domain-containing protein
MKILKRIRGLIFHNLQWKALSVAIAMVIWAMVATEPELSTFAAARLEYRNLPDDLEIADVEPTSDVSLELRGPSGELRGAGDGNRPVVVFDMSAVTPGVRTFPIGASNIRLSGRVHLMRAIPSEVRFRFERRLVRAVPVRVRVSGEGANGYTVAGRVVQPDELTVVGPSSNVSRITDVATDPVDVSNVVGAKQFHVNAFVGDPYVRFRGSPTVVVTVTMKKMP